MRRLFYPPSLSSPLGGGAAYEEAELKGFSRTVAELEWLVLALVLLYLVVFNPTGDPRSAILMGLMFFGAFVLTFHYTSFYRKETRWKLALETWAMILFVTWVLWYAGGVKSPLVNLYLLAIVTSALTLGKLATFLEMGLIAACHILLGGFSVDSTVFSDVYWTQLLAQLAPMLLVAYVTTMLAADIRYAIGRIKLLAETDDLTGVLNMRAFSDILEREASLAGRYGRPFSILMVDSDNLKSVNDSFGHEAGNKLLLHLVRQVQEVLRATDVLARYGGDEFVVLLPETSAGQAKEVAERARAAIEGAPLEVRGTRVPTTVSIGLANFPQDGNSAEHILEKADQAMYRSKQRGKNTLSTHSAD